jgi:hypothetical protein
MLLKRATLDGIVAKRISFAFRRWRRALVRPSTRLRTAVGLVVVDAVDVVGAGTISARDAQRAGYPSRAALLADLDTYGKGAIHRVTLHFGGADPRVALRARRSVTKDELAAVTQRLQRLDTASRHGPWTRAVLRLIGDRPGARAVDLAAEVQREKLAFKADVRKLKELGLTESLEVGYRLSPRGRAVLRRLR